MIKDFIVDKKLAIEFLSEARTMAASMFIYPLFQIACYSYVECGSGLVRHDVNVSSFGHYKR